jgi:uncharacterized protein (DUF2147 family)
MRKSSLLCAALALGAGRAVAADPTGDWVVADKSAIIRVAPCGEGLCGTVAWTAKPGIDENNPDPRKRGHSIVGTQILIGMKPAANRWEGSIYNPENGKIYSGNITLRQPDVLRVEGCLLVFCGGENWTRR